MHMICKHEAFTKVHAMLFDVLDANPSRCYPRRGIRRADRCLWFLFYPRIDGAQRMEDCGLYLAFTPHWAPVDVMQQTSNEGICELAVSLRCWRSDEMGRWVNCQTDTWVGNYFISWEAPSRLWNTIGKIHLKKIPRYFNVGYLVGSPRAPRHPRYRWVRWLSIGRSDRGEAVSTQL